MKLKIGDNAILESCGEKWYINGNPVTHMLDMGEKTLIFTMNETFEAPKFNHNYSNSQQSNKIDV